MGLSSISALSVDAARFGAISEVLLDDLPYQSLRECMDFTLVYWDTTLKPSANNDSRVWEKHSIRRYFSGQLEHLWNENPVLQWYDPNKEIRNALGKRFEKCGIRFIPLVMEDIGLICELDIAFLRPGRPGKLILDSGDIDNRIKTLLDALRVPTDSSEMPMRPGETSPNPVYCLTENDSLIVGLKVTTDQLLVPETADKYEACLSMRVTVRGVHPKSPYEFRGT